MKENHIEQFKEHLDKLEVLSEIYNELSSQRYPTRKDKEIGKLKMKLIKKEMLLLTYLINKDIVLSSQNVKD